MKRPTILTGAASTLVLLVAACGQPEDAPAVAPTPAAPPKVEAAPAAPPVNAPAPTMEEMDHSKMDGMDHSEM